MNLAKGRGAGDDYKVDGLGFWRKFRLRIDIFQKIIFEKKMMSSSIFHVILNSVILNCVILNFVISNQFAAN